MRHVTSRQLGQEATEDSGVGGAAYRQAHTTMAQLHCSQPHQLEPLVLILPSFAVSLDSVVLDAVALDPFSSRFLFPH